MSISIITLAWRSKLTPDYATRYITGVKGYEPEVEAILVDCNSKPPYTPHKDYKLVNVPEPLNIARCMNEGISASSGDWLMFGNDDVECNGKFAEYVHTLDQNTLYAKDIVKKRIKVKGSPWTWYDTAHGWITIMHRDLYNRMGELDETYPNGGDDIEYSMRAHDMGVPIKRALVPFKHIHHHRRG